MYCLWSNATVNNVPSGDVALGRPQQLQQEGEEQDTARQDVRQLLLPLQVQTESFQTNSIGHFVFICYEFSQL